MQFYPIKLVRELIPVKEVEWEVRPQVEWLEATFPTMWLKDQKVLKSGEVVPAKWMTLFEITPETIRWQYDISVRTNLNSPTLKQLERNNMIEFMNATIQFSAAIQADPKLSEIIDPWDFIKDMAFKFNVDIDWIGDDDDVQEDKKKLMEEMTMLANWMREWQQLWATPEALPWQGWQVQPQVRTPNIPTMQSTNNPLW